MFLKLKDYIFLPIAMLVLSVYLLGLSLWQNRSYEILVLPGQTEDVQNLETEEVDTSTKLNLNTATKEDLMKIDGIGEKTAESILEKRERLGGFSAVEQLIEVKGIGEKTLENLKKVLIAE